MTKWAGGGRIIGSELGAPLSDGGGRFSRACGGVWRRQVGTYYVLCRPVGDALAAFAWAGFSQDKVTTLLLCAGLDSPKTCVAYMNILVDGYCFFLASHKGQFVFYILSSLRNIRSHPFCRILCVYLLGCRVKFVCLSLYYIAQG